MNDLRVRLTGRARRHIKTSDAWWRENRPSVRTRVTDEFARLVSLLAGSAGIGKLYEVIEEHEIRRHPLRGTPYYVYYCIRESAGELWIVAVWSAERKRGPQLQLPPKKPRG